MFPFTTYQGKLENRCVLCVCVCVCVVFKNCLWYMHFRTLIYECFSLSLSLLFAVHSPPSPPRARNALCFVSCLLSRSVGLYTCHSDSGILAVSMVTRTNTGSMFTSSANSPDVILGGWLTSKHKLTKIFYQNRSTCTFCWTRFLCQWVLPSLAARGRV